MPSTNGTVAETDLVAEQVPNGAPLNSDTEKADLSRWDVAKILGVAPRIVKRFKGPLQPERVKPGRQWCNGYRKSPVDDVAKCIKNCETLRDNGQIEPINGKLLVLKLEDELNRHFKMVDLCADDPSDKFFSTAGIIERSKSESAVRRALENGTLKSVKIYAHNTLYVFVVSEKDFDSWKDGFQQVDGPPSSSKWATRGDLTAFAGAKTISERRNVAARIGLLENAFADAGQQYTQTRRIEVRGTNPYVDEIKFYLRKPFEKALSSSAADVKFAKKLLANGKEVPAKEMLRLLRERGHIPDTAYQILRLAGAEAKKLGRGHHVYRITGRTGPRTQRPIRLVMNWLGDQLANGPVLGQLLLQRYLKSRWDTRQGKSTKHQLWSASRKLKVMRQYIAKFGSLRTGKKQIGGLPVFWRLPDQPEISDDDALRKIEEFRADQAKAFGRVEQSGTGTAPPKPRKPVGGRQPMNKGNPQQFQVYQYICERHKKGSQYVHTVDKLKNDQFFVAQLDKAGLSLTTSLVRQAVAWADMKARRAQPKKARRAQQTTI